MLVHLDTDIGGDIDDLCALALLLSLPEVELCGVTTVLEHGGRRAGYAHHALELAGRADVPVAAGADVSLGRYTLPTGLPDEARYWPSPVPPVAGELEVALDLLEQNITRGATIVGIGPFTNLALMERSRPGTLAHANVFLMGGTLSRPHDDYNVQCDAPAAACVMEACDVTLVPLEVTFQTALLASSIPALEKANPLTRLIAMQAAAFAQDYRDKPPGVVNYQHDPLACAVACGWSGVTISRLPLRIDLEGDMLHLVKDSGARPRRIVTAVEADRFNAFWLEAVTRGAPG